MTVIRHIDVRMEHASARAQWQHFIEWVLRGERRLACDELACLRVIDDGTVTFVPLDGGRHTRVVFRLAVPEDDPPPRDLELKIESDLVVFKDYVERGGREVGAPTGTEAAATEIDETRGGRRPRHERLSSENDTTFWRHHFPT